MLASRAVCLVTLVGSLWIPLPLSADGGVKIEVPLVKRLAEARPDERIPVSMRTVSAGGEHEPAEDLQTVRAAGHRSRRFRVLSGRRQG